ncbi:UNVERIFIED_CONTAM: replication/maintenance protein RepL, partial [Prevotella sp. 15_C9]
IWFDKNKPYICKKFNKIKPFSMAKKSVVKEQTVRYETWVNPQTGESREFAVVDKPYQSDYNFHKVWLNDLAKVMGILGGAKIQVFS